MSALAQFRLVDPAYFHTPTLVRTVVVYVGEYNPSRMSKVATGRIAESALNEVRYGISNSGLLTRSPMNASIKTAYGNRSDRHRSLSH